MNYGSLKGKTCQYPHGLRITVKGCRGRPAFVEIHCRDRHILQFVLPEDIISRTGNSGAKKVPARHKTRTLWETKATRFTETSKTFPGGIVYLPVDVHGSRLVSDSTRLDCMAQARQAYLQPHRLFHSTSP